MFLPIQLLNELFYPFNLTYRLYHSLLITFSILNAVWFVFFNSSLQKDPAFSFPLRSLTTYFYGTVLLTFLITKPSSDHLECNLLQTYFCILVF